jgi:predicted RNA binding protein YcfA (HicA-like mRNA interferase family)
VIAVTPRPQKYRDVARVLRANGYVLLRRGRGSHELWGRPGGGTRFAIANLGPGSQVSAGIIGQLSAELDEIPEGWR